ncbi:MAG: tetratricopeptide repeat protein [Bacteroidaceae bacterium]|nr:tetratricopeptide repeat protein [Bacteroidaceae bacterium]MBQ5776617.1 tetratricopeptide repeat protein [Bacteroidaceae bacterium]
MIKKLSLPFLLLCVFALVGCDKEMAPLTADYFTVNPSPLEAKGGLVNATVTGTFPEKYFNKNAVVTVTPYMVYAEGETAGTPFVYQGEKVQGNDQTISYKAGGVITMPVAFKYIPEMQKSALYLAFNIVQGKNTYELPRVKVAEGVLATAELADAGTVAPAIAADKFQRIIKETYSADIKFLIQQTNIRAKELKSEEMAALNEQLRVANTTENLEIDNVNISSYASPDGNVDLNTRIAEGREANTVKAIQKQWKKDKIEAELTAEFTAEDWAGFKELVSASNIQDKNLILRVLEMYSDPEQREREIKNLSSVYGDLAEEILPQLRRSRITASINVIGKSDEEIAALAQSNPAALTVDELLYAAAIEKNPAAKSAIYKKVTEIYPEDYRGYNNVGMMAYKAGNYEVAARLFDRAAQLAPESAEVVMNQGLIDLQNGEYNNAAAAFGKAGQVPEVNEALGVYYIKKGDYNAAVRAFGDAKSNNAALAQIMVNDYNKARTTLAAISTPDATTYYLLAVLGARTNNEQMVTSNLRQSFRLDANMREAAAKDLEFAKFDISAL